ncbi:MAG: hypothetical protein M3O23_01920, partial [Actinomycetota bacterium]|nr:hypothetical protein [Actinomycetota bacterium]
MPAEVGPAAAEFNRLLDEADEFCRAGDLLTLATPPDTAAFRRWFLDHLRGPDRERTTDAVAGVRR